MNAWVSRSFAALGIFALTSPAFAVVDYTGLDLDVTGIDAAAIAIATVMMGVLGVFWGVKKIMSLVG